MITEFPALVYQCPGPHAGPHGKTYETRPVATPEALAEAVREGWHWSLDEVAQGLVAQPEDARAGLVAQAEKLGIDVDGRWSDRRLRQEIDAAVKAASL